MKKYILFGLLVCSLGAVFAQSAGDCVQGISTDPGNPVKSNPTDPVFHENTFDWREMWYANITSQAEIDAEGGFEISEIAVKQMEKIEELYLNVLQLHDRITELESQLIEAKQNPTSHE